MNIYKNDRDYGTAAGDATLGGAVYRVYYPQGTGETYSDITTDETGFAMVENMPFGQIRVQEITAPTGYKLDPIVHTYNITSGGNEEPFVLDNFSLRDEVIKGQIAIKRSLTLRCCRSIRLMHRIANSRFTLHPPEATTMQKKPSVIS